LQQCRAKETSGYPPARSRARFPSFSSSRFSNRLNVSRKPPSLAIASPQRPPIHFFREGGNLCAASSCEITGNLPATAKGADPRRDGADVPGGLRRLGGWGKARNAPQRSPKPRGSAEADQVPLHPVASGNPRAGGGFVGASHLATTLLVLPGDLVKTLAAGGRVDTGDARLAKMIRRQVDRSGNGRYW